MMVRGGTANDGYPFWKYSRFSGKLRVVYQKTILEIHPFSTDSPPQHDCGRKGSQYHLPIVFVVCPSIPVVFKDKDGKINLLFLHTSFRCLLGRQNNLGGIDFKRREQHNGSSEPNVMII